MGLTGELVKSVFSRSRSSGPRGSNAKSSAMERRRWGNTMRSYLCGEEFNSVLAEEDSASVKSSEATVTQPPRDFAEAAEQDTEFEEGNKERQDTVQEKQYPVTKLFHEEDAAVLIQSAFRRFRATRKKKEIFNGGQEELNISSRSESPSKESIGTSVKVPTSRSVQILSVQDKKSAIGHLRHISKTQVSKPKEDWDDSTVSSSIAQMRLQSRLEAMTRRERALAYAFSQQLRICSKKRQPRTEGTESNVSWSWLERWMATRVPESPSARSHTNKQLHSRHVIKKRMLDASGEEKESCASNEVPVPLDSFIINASAERKNLKPARNSFKATRVTRLKRAPSHRCPKVYPKVTNKNLPKELATDRKPKQKQMESKKEIECKDAEAK